jgi:hypothetical protein
MSAVVRSRGLLIDDRRWVSPTVCGVRALGESVEEAIDESEVVGAVDATLQRVFAGGRNSGSAGEGGVEGGCEFRSRESAVSAEVDVAFRSSDQVLLSNRELETGDQAG